MRSVTNIIWLLVLVACVAAYYTQTSGSRSVVEGSDSPGERDSRAAVVESLPESPLVLTLDELPVGFVLESFPTGVMLSDRIGGGHLATYTNGTNSVNVFCCLTNSRRERELVVSNLLRLDPRKWAEATSETCDLLMVDRPSRFLVLKGDLVIDVAVEPASDELFDQMLEVAARRFGRAPNARTHRVPLLLKQYEGDFPKKCELALNMSEVPPGFKFRGGSRWVGGWHLSFADEYTYLDVYVSAPPEATTVGQLQRNYNAATRLTSKEPFELYEEPPRAFLISDGVTTVDVQMNGYLSREVYSEVLRYAKTRMERDPPGDDFQR